jgi:ATP-dependent RNA helicase SUPV3L1/SUV3
MPLLLKPAPTRLRLLLWSLHAGLDVFPEAPPPGLVTVPVDANAPAGVDRLSGYRNAGDRAIRIDMLERLADLLRVQDSHGGFEATADMLSITGMTLEQFANLMEGLGYVAARAEREKQRAEAPVSAPEASEADAVAEEVSETPAEDAAEISVEETEAEAAAPEVEVFYTFTWGRKPKPRPQGGKRQNGDQPRKKQGGKPKGKPNRGDQGKARSFEAKPKKEKQIDPDNPFAAALMGLKK